MAPSLFALVQPRILLLDLLPAGPAGSGGWVLPRPRTIARHCLSILLLPWAAAQGSAGRHPGRPTDAAHSSCQTRTWHLPPQVRPPSRAPSQGWSLWPPGCPPRVRGITQNSSLSSPLRPLPCPGLSLHKPPLPEGEEGLGRVFPAGKLASAQALRQRPLLKGVGRSCGQARVISETSVRSLRPDNGAEEIKKSAACDTRDSQP